MLGIYLPLGVKLGDSTTFPLSTVKEKTKVTKLRRIEEINCKEFHFILSSF